MLTLWNICTLPAYLKLNNALFNTTGAVKAHIVPSLRASYCYHLYNSTNLSVNKTSKQFVTHIHYKFYHPVFVSKVIHCGLYIQYL